MQNNNFSVNINEEINEITYIKNNDIYLCYFSTNTQTLLKELDFDKFKNNNFDSKLSYYVEESINGNEHLLLPSFSGNEMMNRIYTSYLKINLWNNNNKIIHVVYDKFPIKSIFKKELITISFDDIIFVSFDKHLDKVMIKDQNGLKLGQIRLNYYCEQLNLLDIFEFMLCMYQIKTQYISISDLLKNLIELIDKNEFDYINDLSNDSFVFENKQTENNDKHKVINLQFRGFNTKMKIKIDKTFVLPDIENKYDNIDELVFVNCVYPNGNNKIYELNLFETTNIEDFKEIYIDNGKFNFDNIDH